MFLCAPTGKIGAQTSASTHFLAKKVSALGSSLPIADIYEGEYFTFQPALLFAASASRLPTTRPGSTTTRFGDGEAGFQASSPEAEVETRGSSAGLSVKRKPVVRPSPDQRRKEADE